MREETPRPEPVVLFEMGNGIATLRLNRPAALNAMTIGAVDLIGQALDRVAAEKSVRVIVIQAVGRAFCVGADLKVTREHDGTDEEAAQAFLDAYNALLNRIESFPKPVIAAVNGLTLGAGLELALACDLVVASDAARIGDGHAKFGLLPGGGASFRLPRRIGEAAAKWLFFTGELEPAAEMQRLGLVQAVYPQAEFEVRVAALAAQIASRSPLGLARLKELANRARGLETDAAIAAEQAMLALHRNSRDRAEGLAAFAEKRPPAFTGD